MNRHTLSVSLLQYAGQSWEFRWNCVFFSRELLRSGPAFLKMRTICPIAAMCMIKVKANDCRQWVSQN
jgi:hypothetical protein